MLSLRNMKNEFAFVVAASDDYISGITAMFNSFKVWGNGADVILLNYNLPKCFLDSLKDYPFYTRVVDNNVNHCRYDSRIASTAIGRFKLASELKEYQAICLLDADMFLTANVDIFFRVASQGFIVTGSNGMNIDFNRDYQKQFNCNLGVDHYIDYKLHTSVPIFLSKHHYHWFEELYKRSTAAYWDDFLYLNMLAIELDIKKDMLCLPPYYFTGIHHFNLKPTTGLFTRNGETILAGTEELVYMIHGKWWDQGWYNDLMVVMTKYCRDNNLGLHWLAHAEKARELQFKQFEKYLNMK